MDQRKSLSTETEAETAGVSVDEAIDTLRNQQENTLSRRSFLQFLALGLATLGVSSVTSPALVAVARNLAGGKTAEAGGARGTVRQWAMVIDLRKCEGCETIGEPPQCIVGCSKEHQLPVGQNWLRVVKEDDGHGGSFYRPIPCMQCENAPCVRVCPVGATYHDEHGTVLINHDLCIGCRICMAACPYDARVFNWTEPEQSPAALLAEYSPEFPVPHRKGTVSKCIFCIHNTAKGKLPVCAQWCPMGAIYMGDLESDVATNGSEVVRLTKFLRENHAYRYREGLGTRPRVYYIPGHGEEFGRRADA